jgi:TatD DNase family protein
MTDTRLIDTHCHIHSADYPINASEVIDRAADAGVGYMICVGTDAEDSRRAIDFVQDKANCWASVGLHPHDAKSMSGVYESISALVDNPKVVAVGECGLDYYYNHSPAAEQERALRFQIELAIKADLPLIFHVRDAFEDFWRIFDSYQGLRGVVHSFTAYHDVLEATLARGLYVGLNGIMTFTKDFRQLESARAVPLKNLVLETDAPFLTPVPLRGNINEPKNVDLVARFLADLRQEPVELIYDHSTQNALDLFTKFQGES